VTSLIISAFGTSLVVIGTVGILRFNDVYGRLQASGVSDNVGVVLVLIGLMIHGGWTSSDWTLLFLTLLLVVTNPIATHSIAKSAFVQRHSGEDES